MLNDVIKYKKNGELHVPYNLHADWIVKSPTVKNRLHRNATCSLKMAERFDLKSKKGILLIDPTAKSYVYIGRDVLDKHEPTMKDFLGVKNSLIIYHVGKIIEENNLQLTKIPREEDLKPSHEVGIAGDIRRKFGL